MVNIKENYYIYQFNHFNKLIQEQKYTKERDNQNSLFDIAVRYQHTPTSTSQTPGYKYAHTMHDKTVQIYAGMMKQRTITYKVGLTKSKFRNVEPCQKIGTNTHNIIAEYH
jgi:hypothetical protein